MGIFDYDTCPVQSGEIRLVCLLPPQKTDSIETVRIEILTTQLDSPMPYTALSWTWGTGERTCHVHVGEDVVNVSSRLKSILKALRKPDQSLLLWNDQICINQTSKDEKQVQIPMMDRVYGKSEWTLAWLGDNKTGSDATFQLLEEIGRKALKTGLLHLSWKQYSALYTIDTASARDDQQVEATRQLFNQLIDTEFRDGTDLLNLSQLCELQYFRRGWIQQEVAIPRRLIFAWGNARLDADILLAAIFFVELLVHHRVGELRDKSLLLQEKQDQEGNEEAQKRWLRLTQEMHDYVHPNLSVRRQYQLDSSIRFFHTAHLLRKFRRLQFTKRKDRILGISGLANDVEAYTILAESSTWEEAFTQTTKQIVQKHVEPDDWLGGVNFLSLCRPCYPDDQDAGFSERRPAAVRSLDDFPSWVPNLSREFDRQYDVCDDEEAESRLKAEVPKHDEEARDLLLPVDERYPNLTIAESTRPVLDASGNPHPFNASRGERHRVTDADQMKQDPRVLLCSGVVIDCVAAVGKHPWLFSDDGPPEWDLESQIREVFGFVIVSCNKILSDSESIHPFRHDKRRIHQAKWRVPILDHEFERTPTECRRATGFSEQGYFDIWHRRNTVCSQNYLEQAAMIKHRAIFRGERGFVGAGPRAMREGDLVCVLHGGHIPFVLRRSSGNDPSFLLVGEAYCDGIMDGEALHIGLDTQTFKLI